MPYADTDFFIALADTSDRLNASASAVYQRQKGRIHTSLAVAIELAIVISREGQSVERALSSALTIARLDDADSNIVMYAAYLIERKNIGVFDAFHAALCYDEIISSDSIYDRIGIIRIPL